MKKLALCEIVTVGFHALTHFRIDTFRIMDGSHDPWFRDSRSLNDDIANFEEFVAQPWKGNLHMRDVADIEFVGFITE